MSGTSSDITIECEPIKVSGEIEIEKVNEIKFHPSLNRKVGKNKSDEEKSSMVTGLICLTVAIPFLIYFINYIYLFAKLGIWKVWRNKKDINEIIHLLPDSIFGFSKMTEFKIILGTSALFSFVLILFAGLGLGKQLK